MREVKTFELRDRATFIPVLAIRVSGNGDPLLRFAGFGLDPLVILVHLTRMTAGWDPWGWPEIGRTVPEAHRYIAENWDALPDRAVVDVEFILGESARPKDSQL